MVWPVKVWWQSRYGISWASVFFALIKMLFILWVLNVYSILCISSAEDGLALWASLVLIFLLCFILSLCSFYGYPFLNTADYNIFISFFLAVSVCWRRFIWVFFSYKSVRPGKLPVGSPRFPWRTWSLGGCCCDGSG